MASTLPEASPHTLLLVADDAAQRRLLAEALASRFPELALEVAADEAAGLELSRSALPELAVLDLQSPSGGITLVRSLLAEQPAAAIVMVTDTGEVGRLQEAIGPGVRQYLWRPLVLEAACEAVAQSLAALELERGVKGQAEYLRKFSRAIDQGPAIVLSTDVQGTIECINARYTELTGFKTADVLGRPFRGICVEHPEEFAALWKELSGAGAEAPAGGGDYCVDFECQLLCKDGSGIPCLVSAQAVREADGTFQGASIVVTDMRTRKLIQDQTLRTQKLESLGVLAGGIAHDFNNVLTGVLGNISFAQALVPEDHPALTPLKDAEEASLRAAELARQLLTFARGGKPIKKRVLVRQLLEDSVALALSGSRVVAAMRLADDVDALEADPGLVTQAFSNILINAAQAMPEGGTVSVEGRRLRLGRRNTLGVPTGTYLRISFRDEGTGIPEALQRRIFDPYFSTKPGSSGLGLASAYTIIVNHGGHIDVRSRAGKGATIICHLPASGELPAPLLKPRPSPAPTTPQRGAVLIMDDEHIVRKVATKMLESLGYRVTACSSGEQAIERYQEGLRAGRPYLAVLMDLTIPAGMGGKEAAREILNLDPQARLVVSSGYFDDPVMADYRAFGFCAVMPKPYKLAELALVMGRLSEEAPGA
ncbi:hypothetical protein GMST_10850 [Geomonas silvestris]|uniref:histidine kinase n=1 Tax=Geomonas silvestris TaxID=2740184 RepID=A0A6V8MFJ2_9BACT|nr:response regulator [Geomonas silvestris]GFO58760.1 hypothetical protein GMST_10850 [Geomonas silvestris]